MIILPPKSVVGNNVTTKASHVTHDVCRIFGSLWKTKKVPGVVIASEKRTPDGSTRNATFITVEWTLPGRVVLKELNGRLVEYVPPIVEVPAFEVAVLLRLMQPLMLSPKLFHHQILLFLTLSLFPKQSIHLLLHIPLQLYLLHKK